MQSRVYTIMYRFGCREVVIGSSREPMLETWKRNTRYGDRVNVQSTVSLSSMVVTFAYSVLTSTVVDDSC